MPLPDRLEIRPLDKPPSATIRVPGSKSITNRALVLAALTAGRQVLGCTLRGALKSEDTEVMVECLRSLGFEVLTEWDESTIRVHAPKSTSLIPVSDADLYCANSGTTMRFLTAMVSLGYGRYRLDGTPRMRERPIEHLLVGLRQLGVRGAYSEKGNGFPPVVIKGGSLTGGLVGIQGDTSSQFLSALLMAAPFAEQDVTIGVEKPLVSGPYVDMTLEIMGQFGVRHGPHLAGVTYYVPAPQSPRGVPHFDIEPDASAASYWFAAAAITKGQVTVPGLTKQSLQGDVRFLDLLRQMGCDVVHSTDGLSLRGAPLRAISADMNDISDTVMTLAAVACFAEGSTVIRNVAHIRHKETDRLAALATELRRVGAKIEEFDDGLMITPRPLHGAEIETYNDHRIAMSMALIGLRVPGIVIKNPGCVAKTYPEFFTDLEKLRS